MYFVCGMTALEKCTAFFVLVLCVLSASCSQYRELWTQSELEYCGWRIRTPALMRSKNAIHVLGRCCGPNLCSSKPDACVGKPPNQHCKNVTNGTSRGILGDDNSLSRTVMKSSFDGGRSWTSFQVIGSHGPQDLGYACSHGLYDRVRERLVVQYHHFGTNSTRPATKVSTMQIISSDDGRTWSDAENITAAVQACSASADDMMYLSAGSKIQTSSGRMLWPAHGFGGQACVWYSDDGGATYNVSNRFKGNEVSVAEVDSNGTILMDGRGTQYPWGAQYRTRYWSRDGGASWGSAQRSPLRGDDGAGCERSLTSVGGVLYTAEPQGPQRSRMVLQCSKDGGQSWPASLNVNHNKSGAYSALLGPVPYSKHNDNSSSGILMVWENNDDGNMYFGTIGTDWCL